MTTFRTAHIKAKFTSRCAACKGTIPRGTDIVTTKDGDAPKVIVHDRCFPRLANGILRHSIPR